MRRPALLVVIALTLGGCSTLGEDRAERCHGARRPANPHGSVLGTESRPTAPAAVGTTSPGSCLGPGA